MSNSDSSASEPNPKHIKSVSSGGESVTIDHNAAKAEGEFEARRDRTNIVNRRVRVPFGIITGARP